MNEKLAIILICIGGFLAIFLPLYLFADPGISPLYGGAETRVALDAQNTRSYAQETRNAEETNVYAGSEQDAEETRQSAPEPDEYEEAEDWQPETEEAHTDEIDAQNDASRDAMLWAYLTVLDGTLEDIFGDNYSLEYQDENSLVVVKAWMDGVTYDMATMEDVTDWETMRESMRSTSEKCRNALVDQGLDDIHISLNVLNDINRDMVLLTTLDEIIVLDYAEVLNGNH